VLDKRDRARHTRKGQKRVILVALGFWTENGQEKREIVDWQIAESEKHEAWEVLLHRLVKRGARAENGLKAIIRDGCGGLGQAVGQVYGESVLEQRCIFHKLKNVRDACRTELQGDDHQEERMQLMQEARAVYHAENAEQAKERLAVWSTHWSEMAPKSVATFKRDFDATIAYYQLEGVTIEWVRSTSLLERVNRQLRRKFRQALSFGSNGCQQKWLSTSKFSVFMRNGITHLGGRLLTLSPWTCSRYITLRQGYNIRILAAMTACAGLQTQPAASRTGQALSLRE
jgi:transposase-like protein